MTQVAEALLRATFELSRAADRLKFGPPVAYVYNPLDYAWSVHEAYVRRFGATRKRIVFIGMNPGPFGMTQTGVPFGEVAAVRDWLKLAGKVSTPERTHPGRPVQGFACTRSEVSGRRLWGLFAQRFGTAEGFFAEHFVANYCPLAFVNEHGANLTPDKLAHAQTRRLLTLCDQHLRQVLELLQPEWLIGIGEFAAQRACQAISGTAIRAGKILHPSPASPAANRDWAGVATGQLVALGVW